MVRTPVRDRVVAGLGSAAVVALLGWVLVFGLTVPPVLRRDTVLATIALAPPPPPPPPVRNVRKDPPRVPTRAAPREKPSPPNLRSKPAEIVAPPPVVRLPPPPPPVVAAPIAGPGMAATAGASDRPGPGYGAGGRGTGFGGGGDGDGDGGTPPEGIKDRLRYRELPERAQATPGSVEVRYTVEADGSVTHCRASRSSGDRQLDVELCRLMEARFRYRPALDADGNPVRSTVVQDHEWGEQR